MRQACRKQEFTILNISYRFTCGEENLYQNVALSHYIISAIGGIRTEMLFAKE